MREKKKGRQEIDTQQTRNGSISNSWADGLIGIQQCKSRPQD